MSADFPSDALNESVTAAADRRPAAKGQSSTTTRRPATDTASKNEPAPRRGGHWQRQTRVSWVTSPGYKSVPTAGAVRCRSKLRRRRPFDNDEAAVIPVWRRPPRLARPAESKGRWRRRRRLTAGMVMAPPPPPAASRSTGASNKPGQTAAG